MNNRRGYKLKLDQPRSVNVRMVLAQLPTDECVRWPGTVHPNGYGVIASKLTPLAHRWIWIYLYGPPDLPEIDHLCRNTACCNPAHLEPVTAAENARRRATATLTCRNGHPWDDVYLRNGWRYCRHCRRNNDRKRPSGSARN